MDGNRHTGSSARPATVTWVIAVLLAVIATCEVMRASDAGAVSAAPGNLGPQRIGARGLFAFAGQIGPRSYGLFMVDTEAGNLWCYEYDRDRHKLRLLAARSFLYDRLLEEYNVESPTPAEVAKLVKRLQAHKAADRETTQRGDRP